MSEQRTKAPRWVGLGLLLVILVNLSGNLYWIDQNVVQIGRDASGHLERTARIATLLEEISPQTLFQALTFTDYRPPALYLAAQPFYALLGRAMDSVQLTNVILMMAILVLTYLLAIQIVSPVVALLATAMTAFLPMLMGMSRLYYTENFLTTVLLLNLLALAKSAGFQRRGWALVWGVTVGLALLVKWTAPIYILLPTVFVLWAASVPGIDQQRLGHSKQLLVSAWHAGWRNAAGRTIVWSKLLLAVAVAVGIGLAVYIPNQTTMQEFLLGDWIVVGWVIVWTLFFYSYTQPQNVINNVLTALWLGVALASFWYLPRIDFLTRLNDVAFGTDRGTQEAFDFWRLSNYTRYFLYLGREHLGLLPALLILPAGLLPWLGRAREWRKARTGIILLWSVLLSTYLFLTPLAQATERNLTPILPVLAILLADALRAYPRWLGVTLGVAWVGVLALQFGLYTFDAARPFQQSTAAFWAKSEYLVQPTSGVTDPGYAIAPDVFATILETAEKQGRLADGKPVTLGMLIDSWEIHRGSFRYLIAEQKLPIELMALTEGSSRGWSELMQNQWVLLKEGDNSQVAAPGQALLQRIGNGDPLFTQLYQEVKRYPLPSGETAVLYYRPTGSPRPQDFPVLLIETAKIADALNAWWQPGATLYLSDADVATWVGIHDLAADRILMPQSTDENAERLLADATGMIFAVTRYDTPQVHDYLSATSDFVQGTGDGEFKLALFWRGTEPLTTLPATGDWGNVQITELRTLSPAVVGSVLPVEMAATGQTDGTRKVSVRLVDDGGNVLAQADTTLTERMRIMLFAPQAKAGDYTIAAILYDPNTLQPFLDHQQRELVPLAPMQMQARGEGGQ
jgi:4-amino-4-deoxy-L-arabinose transferase-like glycosyltransferase